VKTVIASRGERDATLARAVRIELRSVLGSSRRALSPQEKGAGSPQTAKRRRPPGRPVPRGGRTRLGGYLERSSYSALTQGDGTHLGLRANAPPFAGRCRTGGLCGNSSSVRARSNRLVRATSERASAPQRNARTTRGCAVRFEEGTRSSKDAANLHSGRLGPSTRLPRKFVVARLARSHLPREG